MVNEIISSIPFEKSRNKKKFIKFWTNNEEFVDVMGTQIRISLTKEDCENLYEKWYLKDLPYVTKDEALSWLKTRIVGSITKFKLDRQRNDEINDSDILMNTSIVYHTESLLEMQICCVLIFAFIGEGAVSKVKTQGELFNDN